MKKQVYGVNKLAYILYKLEGVDYETSVNGRNKVIFSFEDTEELKKVCDEWEKIQNNVSNEVVNLGRYIYIRHIITDTMKNIRK